MPKLAEMSDRDFHAWIGVTGYACMTIGAGFQWGWPAGLFTLGVLLTGWTHIKIAMGLVK